MEFPSYKQEAESPSPAKPGLEVKLSGEVFKMADPVALYGAYTIDGAMMKQVGDDAFAWTMVVAIRRDQPGVYSSAARPGTTATMQRPPDAPAPPPEAQESGWFNLDLRKHLDLPVEPGRYWLFVALGEYITERMSFEIQK